MYFVSTSPDASRIYNCYHSQVPNQLRDGICSQTRFHLSITDRQLNPKYKQQDNSHLLQGESLFPGSHWGIADMLQIPVLHLAFSNLFVYSYLKYLPFGCIILMLHRLESSKDQCKSSRWPSQAQDFAFSIPHTQDVINCNTNTNQKENLLICAGSVTWPLQK